MSFVRHHDPDAFLAAAMPLVGGDIAHLVRLRAWVDGSRPIVAAERSFMATWQCEGAAGVAFQRGEGAVSIGASAPAAAIAFAEALYDEYRGLDGVVGTLASCEAFMRAWQGFSGKLHSLRFRIRDHLLRDLVLPPVSPGRIRVAGVADRAWLIEMQRSFAIDARVPVTSASLERQVDARLAADGLRIWSDGDDVAYAGFGMAGPDAARIAPVYTRPPFRARGYASALVATVCAELIASGRQVFLATDVANPTSNALYARLGFVPLGDSYQFDLVDAN